MRPLAGGQERTARVWCWVTFGEQSRVISRERRRQPVTEVFLDAVNSHEKHGSFFGTEPEHRLESRRIVADF